ncbi:hypothetical protein [Sphingomonas sp.]
MTGRDRVALALACLAAGAMWWPVAAAIERLDAARAARAAVLAELAWPMPPALEPVVRGAGAANAIAARARILATRDGLLVERAEPVAAPAVGVAAVALTLSGNEKAVLNHAAMLVQAEGLRWRRWTIEAQPGGAVRLSGEAIAPWA